MHIANESDFGQHFTSHRDFLDTASIGLLPKVTADALHRAVDAWACGEVNWFNDWLTQTDVARALFGAMVGAAPDQVVTGPSTSVLVALIAHSLPQGARIVTPSIEFTSNLFPYLVQKERGVEVITVAEEDLLDAIDESTTLVSLSAVQSATGQVCDLDAIRTRTNEVGALLAVDATQAAGWLPLHFDGLDALVCSGYKWLLSPRGAAYMALSDRLRRMITPLYANWYGGENISQSFYGPPLRLATTARGLDPSPAWLSWVGAVQSLTLINSIGVDAIHAHDTALATRFLTILGQPLPTRPSAIVSLAVQPDFIPDTIPFAVSVRDGRLRVSFHLYNTSDDVERAAATLRPHVIASA
ncbi:MAG: aminotransferase class V-fold PLP-dependent enzyme [Ferrimicrobium sp.]|jgi:selenocysteine lyase/cysteine desulfurase|nr:aminotransferase class V-fold PLP-dependent enzyme [Ferrimicrobium sp.]